MDEAILKHAKEADEVWHAGDFGSLSVAEALQAVKPLRGVYGNIDGTEIRKGDYLQNLGTSSCQTR